MTALFRCWYCHAPIIKGERCGRCGRGWLVEAVECGRNIAGYLVCHFERRCNDCPLNNPISEHEREIAAARTPKVDEG